MEPKSAVVFYTKRLYAREMIPEDSEGVFAYSGDIKNSGFMAWSPMSREGVERFCAHCIASQIAEPRKLWALALCRKSDDSFIGTLMLTLDESLRQGEAGYILLKEHWHNGYAAEALKGLLAFGFLGPELHRITAECDDKNSASVRVLEKAGMRREAHEIKSKYTVVFGKKGWRSIYRYAMLQKEFLCSLADGCYSPQGSAE